jgi:hypothetical protein
MPSLEDDGALETSSVKAAGNSPNALFSPG